LAQPLLLIADIGGYTRFMNANRTTLSHAQQRVADLLEPRDHLGFMARAVRQPAGRR